MRLLAPILIAFWMTAIAHADEPKTAEEHYQAGATAYNEAKYAEASEHFSKSYDLKPDADVLWAWAQSERLALNCVTAAGLYRKWARENPSPKKTQAAN